MINNEKISPCGLYCGVCAIYNAHQRDDLKLKKLALAVYKKRANLSAEAGPGIRDIECGGCRSANLFAFCRECIIRECNDKKGYEGCYQCGEFPCSHIDKFPIPEAREIILRSIPEWKEKGTDKWVRSVEDRYTCKECGGRIFRGITRCPECRARLYL